jgi:chromosome segregation ATPase
MGMKHKAQGDRMVFDASHYVGQIRRRITDLNNETSKLRAETDQITKDNSQYSQFEKKYEALIKSKDSLEGQLADYNLAMDKARTSTDPDEVLQLAHHLADKNRHGSQELDRVFMVRKQREGEVAGLEEQLEAHYRAIQARINELEPGKLRAYNDLMAKQREYQEKTQHSEHKLNELTARLRQLEADDKGSSLRKEYVALEKAIQGKKRELQTAQEELDIVNLEPKEAHSRYVARVNEFKQAAKTADERINQGKEETARIKKALAELNSSASETPDNGDAAKYELLQKRDQDMTAFMDKFDDVSKTGLASTLCMLCHGCVWCVCLYCGSFVLLVGWLVDCCPCHAMPCHAMPCHAFADRAVRPCVCL